MNKRLLLVAIFAFSILTSCTILESKSTQTPTQCYWVYRDFTVDPTSLIHEFSSAGIPIADVEISGNGEGGNCTSGYGNAWVAISFSVDDSNYADPESLGGLFDKLVTVIDHWAKTTPPAEVYNFSESSLFLNISFKTSTSKINKPFSEILELQQRGLSASDFWQEAIKK